MMRSEAACAEYRAYLAENQTRFPPGAYALATSDWYFDPRRHECPHDAWLEWVRVEEPSTGERNEKRAVAITLRLLGAYHDGIIELHYPRVFEYRFDSASLQDGHRDWCHDEFRVNDKGQLVHEIEWCGAENTSSWLIVASDIEFAWTPAK